MGFWIFMLLCNLIMPLLMIFIGILFLKHPPKTINGVYGYRTTMSGKNQDTWDYAHECCGRLWWKIGWIMLILSVLVMLPTIGKGDDTVGIVGGVWEAVQCFVLILSIFPVEAALKRKFDKDGNLK